MTTLSFTSYVDAPAEMVSERVSKITTSAPPGAVIDVVPFLDCSQIVVRLPWNEATDSERSVTTLAATRFVRALDLALLAA